MIEQRLSLRTRVKLLLSGLTLSIFPQTADAFGQPGTINTTIGIENVIRITDTSEWSNPSDGLTALYYVPELQMFVGIESTADIEGRPNTYYFYPNGTFDRATHIADSTEITGASMVDRDNFVTVADKETNKNGGNKQTDRMITIRNSGADGQIGTEDDGDPTYLKTTNFKNNGTGMKDIEDVAIWENKPTGTKRMALVDGIHGDVVIFDLGENGQIDAGDPHVKTISITNEGIPRPSSIAKHPDQDTICMGGESARRIVCVHSDTGEVLKTLDLGSLPIRIEGLQFAPGSMTPNELHMYASGPAPDGSGGQFIEFK